MNMKEFMAEVDSVATGFRYGPLPGGEMHQFVLTTPLGERYATLVDLPLTRVGEQMLIGALRDGFAVTYEKNGATPAVHHEASPVATKPRRVVKPRKPARASRKQRRAESDDPIALRTDRLAIGDTVYLYWSNIEAKTQSRLSQYRMTKGVIAETQSGIRSIGVRFNDDPEVIWLKRADLSRVPEVS